MIGSVLLIVGPRLANDFVLWIWEWEQSLTLLRLELYRDDISVPPNLESC